ncbi:hypothetical protein D3C87_1037890 [compost metagenome]
MHIETVAFDNLKNEFSKTNFSIDTTDFEDIQLEKTDLKVDYEYLGKQKRNTYYSVTIEELYHNKIPKPAKRNLITEGFTETNFGQSIFENYPYEIFHDKITFKINGKKLVREDFVVGKPSTFTREYTDKKGRAHDVNFYFYNIKSQLNKVKVFLQIENAGIKSVAHEFTYSSDWYTPDLGTWFIYVDSAFFDSDLFRNIDLESLGEEEIRNIKNFIKDITNDFFKAKNKRFEKFIVKLENDRYYPYKEDGPASNSQEIVFKKVAYLLEDEHKLISNDDKIRDFIYPLVDKAITNGDIEYIFKKIIKLSDENLEKFHDLLVKTDLEDVVHFTSQVADKIEFLEFLHELTYGEIAKHVKERSQLHKIIENELWLFGENYNGTPNLWSDKKIGNILNEIRTKHFNYEPTEEDENIIQLVEGTENITDLFFLNEKVTDNDEREIMVVELKSPKCAIGEKELSQIDKYAYTIEQYPSLPSDKVKYKLLLISSKLTSYAKSKMKSSKDKYPDTPFLYDKKKGKNIEVYVMEWSELIELNKRKLGYLSRQLDIKDRSVKDKFEEEYSQLIDEKINAQLRLVR